MLSRIAHRGPDDEGYWQSGPLAIGHRRLAIVDLSPMGHQPMTSASGRFVMAFNGEIYNHKQLRLRLVASGITFHGHSDTEVLLALVESVGLLDALRCCVGMFAIAMWDSEQRVLHLARDRFGEKPLYYGWGRNAFLFGSELKALQCCDTFDSRVDAAAVERVLQRGFVPSDRSIYSAYRQVQPGVCLAIPEKLLASANGAGAPTTHRYWDSAERLLAGSRAPFDGSFHDAVDELETYLRRSISLQLQADVPVGALLSGGVDSSITTALMCAEAGVRVRSYSIGFTASDKSEAKYAKTVAAHLGSEHTEWYVDESEALRIVPDLCNIYDEPLADASQIPTLILARLVRQDVVVALSGDGADEVFGGYDKYARGQRAWRARSRRAVHAMAGFSHRHLSKPLRQMLPFRLSRYVPWHRLPAAEAISGAAIPVELADRLGMLNHQAPDYLSDRLGTPAWDASGLPAIEGDFSYRRTAMLSDILSYLPGDILTKVDRAMMAASLECRAPFLDHRIFEFSATLPESFLFDEAGGKAVLRALLYRHVPRKLVDRPKSGFSPPLGDWLRGSLRNWAYDLLSTAATANVLAVDKCRALLDLHCEGRFDISARLWPMLSIAAWADSGGLDPTRRISADLQ